MDNINLTSQVRTLIRLGFNRKEISEVLVTRDISENDIDKAITIILICLN